MAEKPKADPIEEVHFRVDELVRDMAALREAFAQVSALINQALVAQKGPGASELAEIRVILDTIAKTQGAAVTRTGTINLPSGPVTMTVREEKSH